MLKLADNDIKSTEFVFHIVKKNQRHEENVLKASKLKSKTILSLMKNTPDNINGRLDILKKKQ